MASAEVFVSAELAPRAAPMTFGAFSASLKSLTITAFPGVSDQTIVSVAVAAEPKVATVQSGEQRAAQP